MTLKTAPVAAKGSPAESNGHIVSHGARARPLPPDGGPKDTRTRDAWIQPVIQSVGEPSRQSDAIARTDDIHREDADMNLVPNILGSLAVAAALLFARVRADDEVTLRLKGRGSVIPGD